MSLESCSSEPPNRQQSQIEVADPNVGIVTLIAEHMGLSRSQVKDALDKGAVWIQRGSAQKPKRIRRVKARLAALDKIFVNYDANVLAEHCLPAKLLADENDYSVWVKPPGMLCQGSKWSDHTTIERWAVKSLRPERPTFVVHRLDRMASGIVLLAHTRASAKHLAAQFEAREVIKRYRVLVDKPLNYTLPYLIDTELNNKVARTVIDSTTPSSTLLPTIWLDEKIAVSTEPLNLTQLDLRIETGRKHQIRQHLAIKGCPVVGDRLYHPGYRSEKAINTTADLQAPGLDLQLQSIEITFMDPTTSQPKTFSV